MTLVPIALPIGVYKNGTDYSAKGRWIDCNRVRWHNGTVRPIGGWERRTVRSSGSEIPKLVNDPETEAIRDMHSYSTIAGEAVVAIGSNVSLLFMNVNNDVSDITPAGFVGGSSQVIAVRGYGIGPYGRQAYGTRRTGGGIRYEQVFRWNFDNWGEDLIAQGNGTPLYSYTIGDLEAAVIPNAPIDAFDFVVTEERFIMTIGSATNSRLVQWSDRENREVWDDLVTNQAGDYTLAGIGKLLSITNVNQEVLILSETDAHVGRYLGPPYVYGFRPVGSMCAPISPNAIAVIDHFAVWMGKGKFWIYDGNVKPLPCEVADYIRDNLDLDQVSKIFSMTITEFNEIWWFFQSTSSNVIDNYVAYDYIEKHWQVGIMRRTAGVDADVLPNPLMVDPNGRLFNHELLGVKVEGAYVESGPIELGQGDKNMAVRYVFPDTEKPNDVELNFYAKQMPTMPEQEFGPYSYHNPISTTGLMGRTIRMRVTGKTSDWQVGTMRFDVAPMGTGMR